MIGRLGKVSLDHLLQWLIPRTPLDPFDFLLLPSIIFVMGNTTDSNIAVTALVVALCSLIVTAGQLLGNFNLYVLTLVPSDLSNQYS